MYCPCSRNLRYLGGNPSYMEMLPPVDRSELELRVLLVVTGGRAGRSSPSMHWHIGHLQAGGDSAFTVRPRVKATGRNVALGAESSVPIDRRGGTSGQALAASRIGGSGQGGAWASEIVAVRRRIAWDSIRLVMSTAAMSPAANPVPVAERPYGGRSVVWYLFSLLGLHPGSGEGKHMVLTAGGGGGLFDGNWRAADAPTWASICPVHSPGSVHRG
jgi:hypothetical protein